ncbi:MAG: type II secretion system protein [Bacilli bacterium]|nr:type II secretion system protein [Bacilli bacterium]
MNNKGFTLVELLAVMVILVSISLVAVGGISASLERRDEKECQEQQELAVGAAKIYFSLNLQDNDGVKIEELKKDGYFSSDKKISRLNDDDVITISENGYLYNGKEIGTSCNLS